MLRSLVFVAALLSAPLAHAGSPVFALADNYPPLMTPDGAILGAILDEANTRLGDDMSIEIESVPWARAVSLVENGRAQALVGTYYRPSVRPWIDPYSIPLMQEHVSIFCRKGTAQSDWNYPEDYAGLTFGYLIGSYAAGKEFAAMVDSGEIRIEKAATIKTNLRKLAAGRIDCFVEGRLPIQLEMSALGSLNGIEMIGDVKVENSFVGFSKDWADSVEGRQFIKVFNTAIESMRKDGTTDRIIASFVNNPETAR